MQTIDHVAIIGGGFSGTLLALNLLRYGRVAVTLIERRAAVGRGVAYSTANPAHLLNVRAANMSAFPDDPGHFVRWLQERGAGDGTSFVPRATYGDYLSALLEEVRARELSRFTVVHGDARELMLEGCPAVRLDDGRMIPADRVVLALGNLPPHDPAGIESDGIPADLYVSDPWDADFTAGLCERDAVMVLGTGLTMVDVVLTLDEAGFTGPIVALSRRGLTPRPHQDGPPPAFATERPASYGASLLRNVRGRAARVGWRTAVDELRPRTQAMWVGAPLAEQRRFIRHLRPWWDVHRHRLAPFVAARIDGLRASGRLVVEAGRVRDAVPEAGALAVEWQPRGSDAIRARTVRRLINCTGPQGNLLRTREPVLRSLLASGHVRPDRHRFGLDVTAQGEIVDANGNADPRVLAVGPMTRGAFWEIVAVPDIRRQVWSIARRVTNAHWVEGEGL